MINIFHRINKKGLHITPDFPLLSMPAAITSSRILRLSAIAVLVAIIGIAAAKGITMAIQATTSLTFYGNLSHLEAGAGDSELGILIMLAPVVGALFLTIFSKQIKAFGKAIGLTLAIGMGGPLGAESPAMMLNGAIGNWLGKLFRCTVAESQLLLIVGATSAFGYLFGAPVASIILALEVFLAEYTLAGIIPIVLAAATTAAGSYLLRGTAPVFTISAAPVTNLPAVLVYAVVGLIVGAWGRVVSKLYLRLYDWLGKLIDSNRWYLLVPVLLVALTGYFSPRILGTGEHYLDDLLQAHVTLAILFALAAGKLLVWIFFSSAYKTGSGITPLLLIGGATGLLLGVVIQLLFPSVVIHSGTLVLVGMGAMMVGTSRTLLTTVILLLEATHDMNTAIPLLIACTIAYGIAAFGKKQRKAMLRADEVSVNHDPIQTLNR
ncbi:chloride channel protein [Chitinophaga polysaccharea]|uniref:chloride channel protein n=1 Tax=Chitinophaga TaxID=79328 RepID=UPI0014550149|nr:MULTISPECIES: chloride channel protein [Chitinophaga]NLR59603.1 chloride channel protein [Chitinophaga polysaccharea]NLU93956.1 chloride channel protein [Chitinophaga sp. Ak27]